MKYPYKYIVNVFAVDQYSEAFSTFFYIDFAEAEKQYIKFKDLGSRVLMYRIMKSDNLDL